MRSQHSSGTKGKQHIILSAFVLLHNATEGARCADALALFANTSSSHGTEWHLCNKGYPPEASPKTHPISVHSTLLVRCLSITHHYHHQRRWPHVFYLQDVISSNMTHPHSPPLHALQATCILPVTRLFTHSSSIFRVNPVCRNIKKYTQIRVKNQTHLIATHFLLLSVHNILSHNTMHRTVLQHLGGCTSLSLTVNFRD